jgi:hypothetical protein
MIVIPTVIADMSKRIYMANLKGLRWKLWSALAT